MKIGLVGCGMVGSTSAFPLVMSGVGREIFSCFNQDQEMDRVDFDNLAARLRQNTVQEKLTNLWLDALLHGRTLAHV